MRQEIKRNILIIIIIIETILLAVASIYIICNRKISTSITDEDNSTNSNANVNNEIVSLPEWVNFLLKQNITEIIYEPGSKYNDITNQTDCIPSKKLTEEQLKDILTKMTASNIRKINAGGFATGPCWKGIIVKYDNYELKIYMSKIIVSNENDNNILPLLEKENYTIEDNNHNQESLWVYQYDWDTSFIDTLF